ncbi:MAG: hypothetical protein FWD61_16745 [Phycisphaerales bacterium]|nr:hypothetical protein [Phycisphaerales bacterium]
MLKMSLLVMFICLAFAIVGCMANATAEYKALPPPPWPANVPHGHPLVATGAWKSVLDGPHPRVYGPAEFLKQLAKDKPELYQKIQNGVKSGNGDIWGSPIVKAVEGSLPKEVEDKFIAMALKIVSKPLTNDHQSTYSDMVHAALIFDFCYEAITPADRKRIIDWLNAQLDFLSLDEGAFHNSTLAKIGGYLDIAYATWGDNPRAKDFRDYAIHKLYEGRLVPVLRQFGDGGGYTEGGWYSRYSLRALLRALETARRILGYDGFAQAPQFYYQRLAYGIHEPYPVTWPSGTERFAMEGDGTTLPNSPTCKYPQPIRILLAQYFRGTELSGYEMAVRKPLANELAGWYFVYEEPYDLANDINTFPLAHLAAGIGRVYARSGWDKDATWFRFECGDMFSQHQHFEAGNFEIFRRESLTGESGVYASWSGSHVLNWYIRSIAHNCILVYDPDEKFPPLARDPEQKLPFYNDGGQITSTIPNPQTLAGWMERRDQYHRGNIVAYQNCPEFMYTAGEYAAAYGSHKVTACTRQVVYIRPGTFVMLDRVTSAKPEFAKAFVMHCKEEPQIDAYAVHITNGAGQLWVQRLLPEKTTTEKINGYTYGGQTFNPGPGNGPDNRQSADMKADSTWRIEVRPVEKSAETVFLHVLSTDDRPEPPAELLRDGKTIGARGSGWQVTFDDKLGGTVILNGKSFPFRGTVEKGKFE